MKGSLLALLGASWLLTPAISGPAAAADGDSKARVEILVVEKKTDRPMPCRIHLKDRTGKARRAPGLPFWFDHFVCRGAVRLALAPGTYTYEVERGPEYTLAKGAFTIKDHAPVKIRLELARLANLAQEGWWSGETHVHRPLAEIELLMRAEDLHVAPVITWWNNRNEWQDKRLPANPFTRFDKDRFYHVLAGEDEREGGALLYFNLRQPLAITGAGREYPSPLKFVHEARRQKGIWIDIEKPFWWDVPTWLASGHVDSIGLANNHMCRDGMYANEAWGKPRDRQRLPDPRGNGFWSQEIYYHLLNCGLRLPPSAGSASGVLPNPVGYNRVYVYVDTALTYEKWWDGLRKGQAFVTNGPLLRVRVNGQLPGHAFRGARGKHLALEVKAALAGRDWVRMLEIIKNGRVERSVPFAEWARTGSLGSVRFEESGWFLVRVIADNPKTYRFASTAPFFVEIGEVKRRVSKRSARFFLDWVKERVERVKVTDPAQRREVLQYHRRARKFWEDILAQANAE
jgi:hypothetical protein